MWYFDMQNKNQNHTTLFHGKHMEAGSLQIPMILALEVWSSNIKNKSFLRLLRGRRETILLLQLAKVVRGNCILFYT